MPVKTHPWSNLTKKIAPTRLARIRAEVDKEVKAIKASTIADIALLARHRLRGADSLTAAPKRLIFLAPATSKKLTAVAKEVSKVVKFYVWPNQVAALLIEKGLK